MDTSTLRWDAASDGGLALSNDITRVVCPVALDRPQSRKHRYNPLNEEARMTAVLDFAMLPPEINSGCMYCGAGARPMLALRSARVFAATVRWLAARPRPALCHRHRQ
jgi:hypothetical protein